MSRVHLVLTRTLDPGPVRQPLPRRRVPAVVAALLIPVLALVLITVAAPAPPASAAGGPEPGAVVGTGMFRPEAIAAGPGGTRYVADTFNNRAVRFAPGSTSPQVVAGGADSGIGSYPGGVAVDASGRVYVADTFNNRVLRFPADAVPGSAGTLVAGGPGTGTSNAGSALDRLRTPSKIALDATGRLFVVDTGNGRVLRFDPGVPSGTAVATGLSFPVGMALDDAGRIYVADVGDHRVLRFTPPATGGVLVAGGPAATSANRGAGLDRLDGPAGVDVDDTGAVYVADTQNHRVVRWAFGATTGELVAGGTRGPGLDQLDLPADVLVDGSRAFWVVDRTNGRVLRFGTRLRVLPEPGLHGLITALALGGAPIEAVTTTATTFTVVGCQATQPLPRSGEDYIALLLGTSYLSVGGPTAGPAQPGCGPAAVTLWRRGGVEGAPAGNG